MIGKVPRAGNGFRGLVNYLVRGPQDAPDASRVAWAATRNLLVDDLELAPRLMRAVAKQSTRCRRPVYHLVISWHQNENPTDALMRTVAETTLSDLQLAEHQAILVAHRDTDHRHLHIVANRVHPGTGKTWHASMDYARIEQSLRRQAEAMNIPYVPGRFNDPERFETVPRRARDPEVQAAIREGKSAEDRWSKTEVQARRPALAALFESVSNWDSLRRALAAEGLVLAAKGQGLVVRGPEGVMKLSELGKNIRLRALEERFGEAFTSALGREPSAAMAETEERQRYDAPLDETQKARLRATVRSTRQALPPASTASDDGDVPATRPARFLPPPQRVPDARRDALTALHAAHSAYDFAKRLAAAGLAGPRDVAAALAELKRARDERRRHLSLAESFVDDIGEALRPASRPGAHRQQSTASERETAWRRKRRQRQSKRRDDRDR